MKAVFVIMVFVLGAALGSFGNVLVYRLRSGVTLGGRSRCLSCGKTLGVRHLVPIFSYIFQRGKCAYCGSRISAQYPFVEVAAGLLAVAAFWRSGLDLLMPSALPVTLFVIDLVLWELLLVIAVYDLRHKIIPDSFALLLSVLGLARALVALTGSAGATPAFDLNAVAAEWWSPWLNLAAGPLLALPFALLWLLSRGRAMGLGDAKLAVGLGFAFGLGYGLTGIVLGFWIGALMSFALLLITRFRRNSGGITMKSELPFAPFLVLGTLVTYIFDLNITSWTY